MDRVDGTAARQLDFFDPVEVRRTDRARARPRADHLQLLRKDVYAELNRRRRRAQIAARHLLDQQ
jgi:predicted nucleic acid-binding Zn ribbon protein